MPLNGIYSCFTITAAVPNQHTWEVFASGRGHPVAGDPSLLSGLAYTNIPRSGEVGLPMGWEAWIRRWRATINVRLVDGALLAWATETIAQLRFNDRVYAQGNLLELLAAPQSVYDDNNSAAFLQERYDEHPTDLPGYRPMWIRENLSYGISVESPPARVEAVRRWLVDNAVEGRLLCWLHLDGVVMSSRRDY